jgi:hypothetical protein
MSLSLCRSCIDVRGSFRVLRCVVADDGVLFEFYMNCRCLLWMAPVRASYSMSGIRKQHVRVTVVLDVFAQYLVLYSIICYRQVDVHGKMINIGTYTSRLDPSCSHKGRL